MKLKHLLVLLVGLFICFSCNKKSGTTVPDPTLIDPYHGEFNTFIFQNQIQDFHYKNFTCEILTPDGTLIKRKGNHLRFNQESQLLLEYGLKAGTYRLLSLKVDTLDTKSNKEYNIEYGLGGRVEIQENGEINILDYYDSTTGFFGKGTEEFPYIITSSSHLTKIRNIINNDNTNTLITKDTHFKQYSDIDMDYESFCSDNTLGWLPIGSIANDPYRGYYDGNNHVICNLWSKRHNSTGIGLFGFVENAMITNVTMVTPMIEGGFAVGGIVGGVVSPGDKGFSTILKSCKSIGGEITAPKGGIGVGGLVGLVDMKSALLIDSCENKSTNVAGMYAAGGLLGVAALSSSTQITNSRNNSSVTSTNTGAGGLVGSVDTLTVIACENTGEIIGSTRKTNNDKEACFATGGLVGGSGPAQILASRNKGNVTGYVGVGGIIGSTRIGSDQLMFNNVLIKSASNTGTISGESSVGGICGEAQLGGYALLNKGSVNSTGHKDSHIGGIAGNTAIAVVYNAINTGIINSDCTSGGAIGGILGKSDWASMLTCQNMANIKGEADHMGGVVALAGNNTMINFCSNSGDINTNRSNSHIGGIVGELGDQRTWSAENIAACVFGSIEMVLGASGILSFASIGKMAPSLKHAKHILHIIKLPIEHAVVVGEGIFMAIEINHMISHETCELMKVSLSSSIHNIDNNIKQEMDDLRNNTSISNDMVQPGINPNSYADFTANVIELNNFNEASEENNELINSNINLKRNERMEELEERKETSEIIHKAIGGVCLFVTAVALVTSTVASAGTAAAAAAAIALPCSSVIGGANSTIEAITDYKDNVAIISQCANYGTISSQNTDNTGAIIGLANDNCWIRDCINLKSSLSPNVRSINGIIGSEGHDVLFEGCLMMGDKWNCMLNNIDLISNNVFYKGEDLRVSGYGVFDLTQLCTLKEYQGLNIINWDISAASENNKETLWVLKEEKGYYPIPQRSEMTDEIKEID